MKIDINIERDLAYALKVKECPQILFLRGNRILYREKGTSHIFSLYFDTEIVISSANTSSYIIVPSDGCLLGNFE